MTRVLVLGFHPSAIDYSRYPGLDEPTLAAQIEQGMTAVREAGFDLVTCLTGSDPDEAEKAVRERLAEGSFDVVMIGGGVRLAPEHTFVFERFVNLVAAAAPGIRFCFNTSPERTIDAIRRWA